MSKIIYQENLCKACGLCIEFCPKKAISFVNRTNEKGYQMVDFDESICTACGNCYRMCPDVAITVEGEEK